MKKSYSAFTLAEVLITLSIIGVVAAIAIPSTIKSFQEIQYKTTFKKVFSDLNTTTLKMKADNNGLLSSALSDSGGVYSANSMRDAYLEYMPAAKTCNSGVAPEPCFTASNYLLLDGTDSPFAPSTAQSKVILQNGAALAFTLANSACTGTMNAHVGTYCGQITIDVNNTKGPHTYGRDIFIVRVTQNGVYPDGSYGFNVGDCSTSDSGLGCATSVLKNEDY